MDARDTGGMLATSAIWVVLVAVLLAAGLVALMLVSRRPEGGYLARFRDLSNAGEAGAEGSAVTQMREAAGGETVSLADLMDSAQESSGYYAVPGRYEARFEELTEGLRSRTRTEAAREEHVSA